MEEISIPEERIKKFNQFKERIERTTHCKVKIEYGNNIIVNGSPIDEYVAKNIITAFARGFDFNIAMRLINDDIYFEYISLKDYLNNDKQIRNVKARIIGRKGKAKKTIEELSNANIAIYGDTIGIIGGVDNIEVAKVGIYALIDGSKHNTAYRAMESMRRKLGF